MGFNSGFKGLIRLLEPEGLEITYTNSSTLIMN